MHLANGSCRKLNELKIRKRKYCNKFTCILDGDCRKDWFRCSEIMQ